MYVVILLTLLICFLRATIKTLGIPLSVFNILLPVFSICTTRLLANLRTSVDFHKHNDLFAGVEMTGLYLGGYLGGIAPARGVEGAIVTEIGNTTIIEVPVVDLPDTRGISRCEDRTGEEGGRPNSDCCSHRSASMMTMSPPLKVSALGATPGWEHWDHRLPTKDFRLPSSSPPDRGPYLDEGEEERPPFSSEGHLPRQQRVQHPHHMQLRHGDRGRSSISGRRSQNRASEPGCHARSNTTLVGNAASPETTTAASGIAEIERPGTSGTERTLVRKGSYYAGWPPEEGNGGAPPPFKPPL